MHLAASVTDNASELSRLSASMSEASVTNIAGELSRLSASSLAKLEAALEATQDESNTTPSPMDLVASVTDIASELSRLSASMKEASNPDVACELSRLSASSLAKLEAALEAVPFKVGDRVRSINSKSVGTVISVDEDGDPKIKFDDDGSEAQMYGNNCEFFQAEHLPQIDRQEDSAVLAAITERVSQCFKSSSSTTFIGMHIGTLAAALAKGTQPLQTQSEVLRPPSSDDQKKTLAEETGVGVSKLELITEQVSLCFKSGSSTSVGMHTGALSAALATDAQTRIGDKDEQA